MHAAESQPRQALVQVPERKYQVCLLANAMGYMITSDLYCIDSLLWRLSFSGWGMLFHALLQRFAVTL